MIDALRVGTQNQAKNTNCVSIEFMIMIFASFHHAYKPNGYNRLNALTKLSSPIIPQ